jgi:predicted nucleic-acid-binding protein
MSIGLDTSVVVRLLVGEPLDQAARAWDFLSQCQTLNKPVHVSRLVVAEAFFVLQHHYKVPTDAALLQLKALLEDQRLASDAITLVVLSAPQLAAAKPGFIDRLIHGDYADHGRQFVTFDRTAARLPDAQLLA